MLETDAHAADRPAQTPAPAGRPAVGDYVLAMGQELRAPLNAVIGMSGLLLDGELADRQRQYVRSIHAAGESLSATLNDLLDLARVQAGRLAIEPIPFDLRAMVEGTARVLSPRAEERGLALRVDWRPELPRHVVGDPGRTRQVLGNLVGHALNGTSQGEVVIHVAPDGESPGAHVLRFVVEDTGIGLPADRLARVFDEYVPVDASPYRSFGITGLGLRISAELVRLMGGDIGAESEVGRGSRLWFRLPMAPAEAAPDTDTAGAAPRQGGRVLVVEADQASRRRFSEHAAAAGWQADFAGDPGRAELALREAHDAGEPYAVCVLSDYAVRPSHADLARRLKADERLAPVALMIVTAVGSPGEARRLWHAGFAAYLRKPLPAEELADALAAMGAVGPDGRGRDLVTRHSLAEARHAQANAQFDGFPGIDRVIAGLTAGARRGARVTARQVALIGVTGADQLEITEAMARAGLCAAPAATAADAARDALATPVLVLLDVDRGQDAAADIRKLRGHFADAPGLAVVALSVDLSRRDDLLAAGADDLMARPVRRADLERVIRERVPPEDTGQTTDGPGQPEPEVTPVATGTAVTPAGDECALDDGAPGQGMENAWSDDGGPAAAEAETGVAGPAPAEAGPDQPLMPALAAIEAAAEEPMAAVVPPEVSAADLTIGEAPAPEPAVDAGLLLPEAADVAAGGDPEAGHPGSDLPESAGLDLPEVEAAEPVVEAAELELEAAEPEVEASEPDAELPSLELDPPMDETEPGFPDAEIAAGLDLVRMEEGQGADTPPLDGFVANDMEIASAAPAASGTDLVALEPAWGALMEDEAAPAPGPEEGDANGTETAAAADSPGGAGAEPPGDPLPLLELDDLPADDGVAPGDAAERGTGPLVGYMTVVMPPAPEPSPAGEPAAAWSARAAEEAEAEVEEVEVEAGAQSTRPVVTATLLEQLGAGTGTFAQHLVASFLRDAPPRIADMVAAARNGDAERLAQAARGLRTMCGLLGAGRLEEVCEGIEAALARNGAGGAASLIGAAEHAFLELRAAVEQAAPAAPPAELPAVGAAFLEQLAPGDDPSARALAVSLAASFRSDAPARVAELVAAIEREDAAQVQRAAPALKSMCGLIGADPLAKLCALTEADARLRRVGAARRYVAPLQAELDRVLAVLGQTLG
jgi:CheY-like chemotaxis protein/nitrogen-specific signal transduction histidine kinase